MPHTPDPPETETHDTSATDATPDGAAGAAAPPDAQPDQKLPDQKPDAKSAREERKRARERIAAATPQMPTAPAPGVPVALETQGNALEPHQLRGVIESLLFVAGRPLEYGELRRLTGADEAKVRLAVADLATELERAGRGVRVQWMGVSAQLVSAPEHARFVAALLGLPTQVRLTTAALETLSVIAYRQPITRGQIEGIRGVNSDRALASLLQHGLAQEVGRAATVGRPVLFGTTPEFMQQFGLTNLESLPRPDLPRAEMAEALRERAAQSIRDAVNAGDAEEAREMERQRASRSGPLIADES
ncbi:MAG TPA: SMC-Scp complex subunit ScpB [Ktedonobacterales bacterium]|nr:SMC-Scp complex subunit ScpB [Ktedonobacterales bacterium]